MAEEAKKEQPASGALGTVDKLFDKFSSYLSARISAFVAFLFMLIGLGTIYGYLAVLHFKEFTTYMILAPFALALIAYYNRTFASILFIGLLFFVFFL